MGYFTVYGSFAHSPPPYMKLVDKQFEPLFEVALQQALSEVLLNWFKQIPIPQRSWKSRRWSSYGLSSVGSAMVQRRTNAFSGRESDHILTIVVAGLSPIIAIT